MNVGELLYFLGILFGQDQVDGDFIYLERENRKKVRGIGLKGSFANEGNYEFSVGFVIYEMF